MRRFCTLIIMVATGAYQLPKPHWNGCKWILDKVDFLKCPKSRQQQGPAVAKDLWSDKQRPLYFPRGRGPTPVCDVSDITGPVGQRCGCDETALEQEALTSPGSKYKPLRIKPLLFSRIPRVPGTYESSFGATLLSPWAGPSDYPGPHPTALWGPPQ